MLRKKLKLSKVEEQNEYEVSNNNTVCNELSHQSIYFGASPSIDNLISTKMINIQLNLNEILDKIDFVKHPICYVYNPTVYANEPYEKYMRLYCNNEKKILFMGINPGPWGMCQTGVPFGEVNMVKNWLDIDGNVDVPNKMCNERRIQGFNCTRKEVSGDRFWNFFKDLCGTPKRFFRNCFLYNYCPLAFMKEKGANITPADKSMENTLKSSLQEACDAAFNEVILTLKPDIIIGIGRYAEKRALDIVKHLSQDIKVLYLLHPSPRTPGNNNWAEEASSFIKKNNLTEFFN